MKKGLFVSVLTAPILLFLYTLLFSSTNLVQLLDLIFYIGLLFLITGSVMLILQGGFFTAFISTTKHFFSTISKKEQAVKHFEGKNRGKASYKKEYPISRYILLLGAIYFSFSLMGSIAIVFWGS